MSKIPRFFQVPASALELNFPPGLEDQRDFNSINQLVKDLRPLANRIAIRLLYKFKEFKYFKCSQHVMYGIDGMCTETVIAVRTNMLTPHAPIVVAVGSSKTLASWDLHTNWKEETSRMTEDRIIALMDDMNPASHSPWLVMKPYRIKDFLSPDKQFYRPAPASLVPTPSASPAPC